MSSDTFNAHAPEDPAAGAAVIRPVTPEMMDEAAHRAAQLADDVAHHVVPAPEPAPAAMAEPGPVAQAGSDPAGSDQGSLETARDAMAEIREESGAALVATVDAVDDAVRDAAERVEETLVRTGATAGSRVSDGAEVLERYNAALLDIVQANLAAAGDHVAALAGAQSLPEVVAINTDHMRRRFDALATQGRDLAALAQKLAFAAFVPATGTSRRDA